MAREKIEGLSIWIPSKTGEKLVGKVVNMDSDGQFGVQATIKKTDGQELLTPSHKWLQNCLRKIKVNDDIEIEYMGDEPPKVKGQSPTKKYEVYRITP